MSTLTVPDNITSKAYVHQQLVQFYYNFNWVHANLIKSPEGKWITLEKCDLQMQNWTADVITAIEPVELMPYPIYHAS